MAGSELSGVAAAVERTRKSYDETPYFSAPLMRSHPGRLAAQALWRGLAAPDAAKARVLEIGCASGGNLLPLAAVLPDASFLGLDLSPAQIAAGEARRQRYGLANVELRADTFEALGEADGEFDFIVCHGVYSWIPEPLRESLMRVVRARLAPTGLAMVSFNVLPGWRVLQIARDAMLLNARLIDEPARRPEKTRELFALLAAQSPDKRTYGKFWRDEAQRMVAGGDAYLAHEIFEDSNAPETFADFIARAGGSDLEYLSEAVAVANNAADLAPDAAQTIEALAGGDRLKRETYIDIFSGRSFREALLVRAGRTGALSPAPPPQTLKALHFLPALDFEFASDAPDAFLIRAGGAELGFSGLAGAAPAMRRLAGRRPGSSSWMDLVPEPDKSRQTAAGEALRVAVEAGLVSVSTLAVACATRLAERPRLWGLAAGDAPVSAFSVTLRHSAFQFAPLQRLLAPLVDGTRTRDDLVDAAVGMALSGRLSIGGPGGPIIEPARMRGPVEGAVDAALAGFLRNALLIDP